MGSLGCAQCLRAAARPHCPSAHPGRRARSQALPCGQPAAPAYLQWTTMGPACEGLRALTFFRNLSIPMGVKGTPKSGQLVKCSWHTSRGALQPSGSCCGEGHGDVRAQVSLPDPHPVVAAVGRGQGGSRPWCQGAPRREARCLRPALGARRGCALGWGCRARGHGSRDQAGTAASRVPKVHPGLRGPMGKRGGHLLGLGSCRYPQHPFRTPVSELGRKEDAVGPLAGDDPGPPQGHWEVVPRAYECAPDHSGSGGVHMCTHVRVCLVHVCTHVHVHTRFICVPVCPPVCVPCVSMCAYVCSCGLCLVCV